MTGRAPTMLEEWLEGGWRATRWLSAAGAQPNRRNRRYSPVLAGSGAA